MDKGSCQGTAGMMLDKYGEGIMLGQHRDHVTAMCQGKKKGLFKGNKTIMLRQCVRAKKGIV
eukprot:1155790-Pelagomonas_calceolata.AAC.1